MLGFSNVGEIKKFLLTDFRIASYVAESASSYLWNKNNDFKQRKRGAELTQKYSNKILAGLNFHIEQKHSPGYDPNESYFMVSNHMSYMDVLCLSHCRPALFVTSVEMEGTFLLGELAKLGGSYFVERRNRAKLQQEIKDLGALLKKGMDVFVFPEGTSTQGMELLAFKRALFHSAILSGKKILPICLRYEKINGEDFSSKNADSVCWYGDMDFFPHFKNLMSLKDVKVVVEYLDPIDTAGKDKHELSEACRELISEAYYKGRELK